MTEVDELWDEVRAAVSHTSVVVRATVWLTTFWTKARSIGHANRSLTRWAVPYLYSDDFMPACLTGTYQGDHVRLLGPRALDIAIAQFAEWGSPTLSGPVPNRLDYLRATVLHEVRHAVDHCSGIPIHKHDRAWFRRLTKLESRFDPRGG